MQLSGGKGVKKRMRPEDVLQHTLLPACISELRCGAEGRRLLEQEDRLDQQPSAGPFSHHSKHLNLHVLTLKQSKPITAKQPGPRCCTPFCALREQRTRLCTSPPELISMLMDCGVPKIAPMRRQPEPPGIRLLPPPCCATVCCDPSSPVKASP